MSFAEGLAIACGVALGYWFVSNFLRGSGTDQHAADQDAARERTDAPPIDGSRARPDGASTSTPPDIPPRWHDVLGVNHDASPEQITTAYRDRLAAYDVTRLDGLAPDLRALADAQVVRIQDAYVAGMRRHPGQFRA